MNGFRYEVSGAKRTGRTSTQLRCQEIEHWLDRLVEFLVGTQRAGGAATLKAMA